MTWAKQTDMHLTTTERVVILYITAVTAVSGLFRGEPTETIGDDCHCVLSHRSLRVVQRRTYRDNWRRLSFCTVVTEVSGLLSGFALWFAMVLSLRALRGSTADVVMSSPAKTARCSDDKDVTSQRRRRAVHIAYTTTTPALVQSHRMFS